MAMPQEPPIDSVAQAIYVKKQLMNWGSGLVALCGVASIAFIGLGVYAMCIHAADKRYELALSAYVVGFSLGLFAMLWRCMNVATATAIDLLVRIAEDRPAHRDTVGQ